ncbi:uncharacterized protein LOC117169729 [Belonocnema kinseyi]|uniref:uncharacterized protein LOC117169729 n=1 Tax=Belonocnema kinseyi TaxID=2817044 RepID=UPI00143CDC5F|nr:uncharacterized protein LOC117169729 [Belonocnema kinseyi]
MAYCLSSTLRKRFLKKKKRETSPIRELHDKSAQEDVEISSNDSSTSAREVQCRIEEKKLELEKLNKILDKRDAQKKLKSRTNRRLSFNEESERFENTAMLGNRSEANSPDHAVVSTKNIQRERSSGGSTCKDFLIDPKTLYNDVVKERHSERAATLPRYESFQHINQLGEHNALMIDLKIKKKQHLLIKINCIK